MSADAVLIDLYDTLVWSEWARWQRALASRLGVTEPAVVWAFDDTRPARSTGAYPDHDGDIAALLVALGIEPSLELVGEVRALEDRELTRDTHLYEASLPVVLGLRERGAGPARASNASHTTRGVVQ